MSPIIHRSCAAILALIVFASQPAGADEFADAGRKVAEQHQAAVLTVKLVVNMHMSVAAQDRKQESRSETIGTVIDPSGLTVISLSAVDPGKTLGGIYQRAMGRSGGGLDFKMESEVTDLKMVLSDGTEVPGRVVLRDNDLDLAFVRPNDPLPKPAAAVDLARAAKARVLDQVICLNRLGKVANRVTAISIERITAIVENPRPFYIVGAGQGTSGVGAPVFAMDGQLVGIMLMRSTPPEGEMNLASMFSGGNALGLMPIIVPAADIHEMAQQAKEAAAKPKTP